MAKRKTKRRPHAESAKSVVAAWRTKIDEYDAMLQSARTLPDDQRTGCEWMDLEILRQEIIGDYKSNIADLDFPKNKGEVWLIDRIPRQAEDFQQDEIRANVADELLKLAMDNKVSDADHVSKAACDRYLRRVDTWLENPLDSEPPVPNDPNLRESAARLIQLCDELFGLKPKDAIYLGDGRVDVAGRVILVPQKFVSTLESLVNHRKVHTQELQDIGVSNPSQTVGGLCDLEAGVLRPYITRPGKENKGEGYSTTIEDGRKT